MIVRPKGMRSHDAPRVEVDDHESLVEFYEKSKEEETYIDGYSIDPEWLNEYVWGTELSEDEKEEVREVLNFYGLWGRDPHQEELKDFWHYFGERNQNMNLPESIEILDSTGEIYEEALEGYLEQSREWLRETFGDSVVLYQGRWRETYEATSSSMENDRIAVSHRPVESWTLEPYISQEFGDVTLRKDLPIDDIVFSPYTALAKTGTTDEIEFLVENRSERIFTSDEVFEEGFDLQENASWALSKLEQ